MLHIIHQLTFYIHVIIGACSLVIFWLPLSVKKGGKNHLFYGGLFTRTMYVVAVSGFIMSSLVLFDPVAVRLPTQSLSEEQTLQFIEKNRIFAGFLLMLSVLVFTNVRQSIVVLKAKQNRELLKTPSQIGAIVFLVILSVIMAGVGVKYELLLYKIFAGISFFSSIGMLHYIFKAKIKQREWIIAHISNILAAGIASYTAFFAFGGRRLFSEILSGNLQIIPWILPSVIGVSAITWLTNKYRNLYRIS